MVSVLKMGLFGEEAKDWIVVRVALSKGRAPATAHMAVAALLLVKVYI